MCGNVNHEKCVGKMLIHEKLNELEIIIQKSSKI